MSFNKVVARFKDGTFKKGTTSDFFPNKSDFHLTSTDGSTVEINIEQLKAIFYVKDFTGDKDRNDTYEDTVPGGGRKIEVEFFDGEMMIGFSQGYSANRPGFFVIPADTKNNNERIFVISSATKKVSFL
jgi:hypothetical protein